MVSNLAPGRASGTTSVPAKSGLSPRRRMRRSHPRLRSPTPPTPWGTKQPTSNRALAPADRERAPRKRYGSASRPGQDRPAAAQEQGRLFLIGGEGPVKTSIAYRSGTYAARQGFSLSRELGLVWAFIRYDVSTTLMPALLFTLAAYKVTSPDLLAGLGTIALSLVYFTLYVYVFCLSNQLVGIEEDRRNKPDRPIVAGLVTPAGAQARMYVAMILFALLGEALGVALWTGLWLLVVLLHNQYGWSWHWFGKNLCMALGVLAELASAWQLVAPLSLNGFIWTGMIALVMFPLVAVQDLRDMRGDRAIGRRTFPLVFGERPTRLFLALGFCILPVLTHITLTHISTLGAAALLCDLILVLVSLAIAARVLLLRGQAADHRTYMLFTYWYCTALATAIVIL